MQDESREIDRVDVNCDHRMELRKASLQNLRDVQTAGAWDILAGGTRTAAPAKAPELHSQLALTGLLW